MSEADKPARKDGVSNPNFLTTNYRMVSAEDGNVYEDLESTTYVGALEEALDQLGWRIVATLDAEDELDESRPGTDSDLDSHRLVNEVLKWLCNNVSLVAECQKISTEDVYDALDILCQNEEEND